MVVGPRGGAQRSGTVWRIWPCHAAVGAAHGARGQPQARARGAKLRGQLAVQRLSP